METIQLQCGNCKNVMAISVAHLGQQVQCPHCQSVVQTQAPRPDPEATAALMPNMEMTQPEGMSGAPQPTPFGGGDTVSTPAEPTPENDFTQFKPKARVDRSVFLLIALIFLVPYALTMTLFLAYLLAYRPAPTDPLEYLPDPVSDPRKGGPRKVSNQPRHTLPIAAHRKVNLKKKVQVGDLEVTPLRVVLSKEGDLKLFLRTRNMSTSYAFEPMNDNYVNEKKSTIKPYTFLETRTKNLENIYGGYLAYHKDADGKDEARGFAVLVPNEQVTIVLATHDNYRPRQISAIEKSANDEFTWRVQLRRGFVKKNGKDVSATTVVGIDFSSKDIEREG